MNKIIQKIVSRIRSAIAFVKRAFCIFHQQAVCGNAGEGYIDTAVKILVAVVLGALLLSGLYALLNDTVLPTVNERIVEMFDYSGTL